MIVKKTLVKTLRSGMKIIQDNEPYEVINSEFVKPGKGQAFNRIKIRNLISEKLLDKILKPNDSIKLADVINIDVVYLYNRKDLWFFINKNTFEEIILDYNIIYKHKKWLFNQLECILTLWNETPIALNLPNFIEYKIINTEPSIKKETCTNGTKLATISTGATIKVPIFIKKNEIIKIDIRSEEYVSRKK